MCTVRLALHPRIASDNRAPELLCRARQPGPVVSSHASCLALQAMEVDGARGGQPEVEALGRALAPGAKYMVNRLEDRVSTAPHRTRLAPQTLRVLFAAGPPRFLVRCVVTVTVAARQPGAALPPSADEAGTRLVARVRARLHAGVQARPPPSPHWRACRWSTWSRA